MNKEWDKAIDYVNRSISAYWALEEPEYPDFATISKAYALMFKGSKESNEEASKVLTDYLAYREATFGQMDSESFKYVVSLSAVDGSLGLAMRRTYAQSLELVSLYSSLVM